MSVYGKRLEPGCVALSLRAEDEADRWASSQSTDLPLPSQLYGSEQVR